MRIGVTLETTARSGHIGEIARRVEAAGFDALFLPEHPVIPVQYKTNYRWGNDGKLPEHYTRWIDPYIGLATAAAFTTTLQLGTGVSLLPEREPLVTAKMIATLDLYANGRTLFAFGAGWLREETEAMGVDFESRWERLCQSIEAMKVLWSEREAQYHGSIINFPPVYSEPKPLQTGGPKILLGVHQPKRALAMIVRCCDGWFMMPPEDPRELGRSLLMLRQLAEAAGRDPDGFTVIPVLTAHEDDIPLSRLEALQELGIEQVTILPGDHGERTTTGRVDEFIERIAHVVERAHGLS